MNNISPSRVLNTAKKGPSVYKLGALLFACFVSISAPAQSLDLSKIGNWNYDGSPEEVKKDRGCRLTATALRKDFLGHFSMDFFVVTHPKAQEPAVQRRLRLKPPIRLKNPDACEKKHNTCTWDSFQVTSLDAPSADDIKQKRQSIYFLTLVTKLDDPEQILSAYLKRAGSFTGERRLLWDCHKMQRSSK